MPTKQESNDRFEELLVRLLPALSEENKINYLYEMRNIYNALKQENQELKTQCQRYYAEIKSLEATIEARKSILEKHGHID